MLTLIESLGERECSEDKYAHLLGSSARVGWVFLVFSCVKLRGFLLGKACEKVSSRRCLQKQ